MAQGPPAPAHVFSLATKSADELRRILVRTARADLVELLVCSLSYDRCLTPREIAARDQRNPREIIADMKAGAYEDPIYGRGFFAFGRNSFRVTVAAANRRRARSFVTAVLAGSGRARESGRAPGYTGQKKDRGASLGQQLEDLDPGERLALFEELMRVRATADLEARENGLSGKALEQKATRDQLERRRGPGRPLMSDQAPAPGTSAHDAESAADPAGSAADPGANAHASTPARARGGGGRAAAAGGRPNDRSGAHKISTKRDS